MLNVLLLLLAAAIFEGIFIYRLLTDAEFRAQWIKPKEETKQ